ncbi:hypothetical protein BMS3Bbin10_01416 [bacterium BMS3Bbin10]|nr:hypothetical protein BMS3Bbin10_01416 [bacterium BMS3Bbin10]
MRKTWILSAIFCAGFIAFTTLLPERAEARCKTFKASHNGTDLFYETGTEGTAKNKLLWYIEQWQKEKGIKRVRIGKVRIKCGGWFIKYMLPHRNCVAKARVCY